MCPQAPEKWGQMGMEQGDSHGQRLPVATGMRQEMDAFFLSGGLLCCGQCLDTSLCLPVLCLKLPSSAAWDTRLESLSQSPLLLVPECPWEKALDARLSATLKSCNPLGIYFPSVKWAGEWHW